MAISREFIFVSGSRSHKDFNLGQNKTELFQLDTGEWRETTTYPFSEIFFYAPVLNYENGFVLFGGNSGKNHIFHFDVTTENWSQLGSLNQGRSGSGAIQLGDGFLIVGGRSTVQTEWCQEDKDGTMKCSSQTPTLDDLAEWPEMISVPEDYCL